MNKKKKAVQHKHRISVKRVKRKAKVAREQAAEKKAAAKPEPKSKK
jgi:hypothetical protein